MAKTNWQMGDTVQPEDLNQVGQEINDNTTAIASHKNAATLDHPDGSVTDAKIGTRDTSDIGESPLGNTGTLTQFIRWFTYMIRQITGKSNWRTAPATTLEAAKSHMDATTDVHGATANATANTIVQRDANGRFKAAAPAAADDVARKADVVTVNNVAMKKTADSDLDMNRYGLLEIGKFKPVSSTTLILDNSAITVTEYYHRIDTPGGAGELHTINGLAPGHHLRLRIISNSRPITLKHGVGNIIMPDGLDYTLANTNEFIELVRAGDNWYCAYPIGVKRSGDTIKGTITLGITGPIGQSIVRDRGSDAAATILLDFANVSTQNATISFFRNLNSSGNKIFVIHPGDGTNGEAFRIINGQIVNLNGRTVTVTAYSGDPNGNVAAPPGSICLDTANGKVYKKATGAGNTGWQELT